MNEEAVLWSVIQSWAAVFTEKHVFGERERERQREREIEAEKIAFGYWKKIFSQITDDLKELEGEGGEGRGFLAILFSL